MGRGSPDERTRQVPFEAEAPGTPQPWFLRRFCTRAAPFVPVFTAQALQDSQWHRMRGCAALNVTESSMDLLCLMTLAALFAITLGLASTLEKL